MEQLIVSNGPLAKYAVVSAVTGLRRPYGQSLRLEDGTTGFVDSADLTDTAEPLILPEGAEVVGVVLGYTNNGRVRLTLRPRDVALARATEDTAAATSLWVRVASSTGDGRVKTEFFASPSAAPLLVWGLTAHPGSADHHTARRLLEAAPPDLRDKVDETLRKPGS
ncbi:hypothetical protein [Streptomyces sp. CBMA29]|uniref:hypothetical protein n=1 Tax=Streptomyces sp. CBMA29 TaxID=1896314 RepID=UPI0016619351|nr:hypothetical protein [Streptomyces sp. CBMA29]